MTKSFTKGTEVRLNTVMEAQVPKLSLTISLYQRSWGNSVNEYVDCRVVLGGEPKEFFFY